MEGAEEEKGRTYSPLPRWGSGGIPPLSGRALSEGTAASAEASGLCHSFALLP